MNLKKSSAGVIGRLIVHVIRTFRSVTLQRSQTLKIVETFFFTHSSYDINDNLSSFTGRFIAENVNNKILKNEPSQRCNKEFKMPDTFLLVPRPSAPPLCNFMLAPYVSKKNDC